MKKSLIIVAMFLLISSCYGNKSDVYSKKLNIVNNSQVFDVDNIENNIVTLISRDLKKVKKIKLSFFKKEIKEGYMVTYVNEDIYVSTNRKLKSKIMKLQFELNSKNQNLSMKL